MRAFLLLALSLTTFSGYGQPSILYVSETGNGNLTGTSWANALPGDSLARRVAGASPDTQFWVMGGLYRPTRTDDRTAVFSPQAGVSIYGGFEGTEETIEDRADSNRPTILSGNIGDVMDDSDNSSHVVLIRDADRTITLDRLTIRDGVFKQSDGKQGGAGICILATQPRLNVVFSNCQLTANRTEAGTLGGGGLYIAAANNTRIDLTIRNCVFDYNATEGSGGAIMARTEGGGGIITRIDDSVFSSNFSALESGAISYRNVTASDHSSLIIRHSQFAVNTAGTFGGAIIPGPASCSIESTIFQSNGVSSGGGGAIDASGADATYTNCLFTRNAANNGGAIYSSSDKQKTQQRFLNCTFAFNAASVTGGAFYNTQLGETPTNLPRTIPNLFHLTNCIVWGNTAPDAPVYKLMQSEEYDNLPSADNSIIQQYDPNAFRGDNNLSADPLFVDEVNGDYQLKQNSPAINAGAEDPVIPSTDLLGKARVVNGTIDIGAYEFECVISACVPFVMHRR
jgi:predicted outer membrane repeat protein